MYNIRISITPPPNPYFLSPEAEYCFLKERLFANATAILRNKLSTLQETCLVQDYCTCNMEVIEAGQKRINPPPVYPKVESVLQ